MDIKQLKKLTFKMIFFLNQILQIQKDAVIVMCSAYDFKANRDEAYKCGMKEILNKPVKKDDLKELLRKYMPEKVPIN